MSVNPPGGRRPSRDGPGGQLRSGGVVGTRRPQAGARREPGPGAAVGVRGDAARRRLQRRHVLRRAPRRARSLSSPRGRPVRTRGRGRRRGLDVLDPARRQVARRPVCRRVDSCRVRGAEAGFRALRKCHGACDIRPDPSHRADATRRRCAVCNGRARLANDHRNQRWPSPGGPRGRPRVSALRRGLVGRVCPRARLESTPGPP